MLPQWGLNMVPNVRVVSTEVVTTWKFRKAASPRPHVDRPAREVVESAKVNAPTHRHQGRRLVDNALLHRPEEAARVSTSLLTWKSLCTGLRPDSRRPKRIDRQPHGDGASQTPHSRSNTGRLEGQRKAKPHGPTTSAPKRTAPTPSRCTSCTGRRSAQT